MAGWKVHVSRVCLPAVFRLQGLVTLLTVYSLRVPSRLFFAPTALVGFALRSFLLQKGIPPVSEQKNPPTVCSRLYTLCQGIGPAGRPQFLGFGLFEVPGDLRVFSTSTAGCSLGLLPSRALHENLGWDFAQPPLTRFPPAEAGQRRLRVSIGLRFSLILRSHKCKRS